MILVLQIQSLTLVTRSMNLYICFTTLWTQSNLHLMQCKLWPRLVCPDKSHIQNWNRSVHDEVNWFVTFQYFPILILCYLQPKIVLLILTSMRWKLAHPGKRDLPGKMSKTIQIKIRALSLTSVIDVILQSKHSYLSHIPFPKVMGRWRCVDW